MSLLHPKPRHEKHCPEQLRRKIDNELERQGISDYNVHILPWGDFKMVRIHYKGILTELVVSLFDSDFEALYKVNWKQPKLLITGPNIE